jgi:hypothetical protein
MKMKYLWIALVTISLGCGSVFAQVGMTTSPTPGIEATSPLGMSPGISFGVSPDAAVAPTGIPLGATELASPGISPAASGLAGMTGYGTTCSSTGGASPGISGISGVSGVSGSSTYDGGGMALGTSSSGSMASCPTASSGNAILSMAPGAVARPGIPLGSVEIGNAGISPLVTVPTPSPSPLTMSPFAMGTLSSSPSVMGTSGTLPGMLPGIPAPQPGGNVVQAPVSPLFGGAAAAALSGAAPQ